jgi:uncharacterized membrane protein HdeD (DUF308 family)
MPWSEPLPQLIKVKAAARAARRVARANCESATAMMLKAELSHLSGLTERWGIIAIRGFCGVIFGLLTLLAPSITLLVLTIWFAAFMALDGVLGLVCGLDEIVHHRHGLALVIEGVLGLAAATAVLGFPAVGIGGFVMLAAIWSAATGIALLWGALLVPFPAGRLWLAVSALISLTLGAFLALHPVALVTALGAYMVGSGCAMLLCAYRLRAAEFTGQTA